MGNSKNKRTPKNRKVSNKSKCRNSSDQKENLPKNKVTKPDPNDCISMSKQLLKKKKNNNNSTKRRSSSIINEDRVCGNGKPIPSLAELEKMFEDSDDDNQSPKSPTQETCTTPKPEKQIPEGISENKLLSPSTINKISERMLDLISNISDPIELLDDVPPPPVIPPKKRKKTEIPYIVGCKDRPKVVSKPSTNFCKGDEDYGVDASGADPEEPPTKRAKKSKIPTYSKSIFNAHSDEIAERLTKDDAGSLSDASSDSNKTIEYNPKLFKSQRPHSFSPLPSTSKDNKTFIKNDELFNKSLTEKNLIIFKDEVPKKEEEIQMIAIPYETIVIDDVIEKESSTKIQNTSKLIDTKVIEIIEPVGLEDVGFDAVSVYGIHNDDDCVMVPSSTVTNNHINSNDSIVIDDEYSNINIANDTFDRETIEIIDVDDIIAENKSILDKWKTNGAKELNTINTVVDVPTTYRNITTPQTTVTQSVIHTNINKNNENNETSSQNVQNNRSLQTTHSQRNVELTTRCICELAPVTEKQTIMNQIVDDFFKSNETQPRNKNKSKLISKKNKTNSLKSFIAAVVFSLRGPQAPPNKATATLSHAQPINNYAKPRSAHTVQNSYNRTQNPTIVDLSQQTNTIAPAPLPPESPRNIGDCPICMDPLSNSNNGIASTICGHVFCLQCIQAAIKVNGKRCPTCRKILKGAGGGYHQLYL